MASGGSRTTSAMHYGETLMYGQYTKELGEFAKQEAKKSSKRIKKDNDDTLPEGFQVYTPSVCQSCLSSTKRYIDIIVSKIGEDWIFLTLLGVSMALISYGMDWVIEKCQTARMWVYRETDFSVALQLSCWICFPLSFICFAVGFVHLVGPNAIGSGIPEMKTILRGVVLKEYLTFRTFVAKVIGLCSVLGCGVPVGKEGPFVHVASITATLLGKLIGSFRGIYENESRYTEMLAAACAVGVSCTFAAPIGGVLFSIEVTSTFFAVRNYWRGFYAAVCGAFVFRLLAVWFHEEETLTAFMQTNLRTDFPFDTLEMIAYSIIGVVCGFAGALFVFTHRKIVQFIRKQKKLTEFLQKNRFIFPSFVVLIIMGMLYPPALGQFMAGELTNNKALGQLFSNFTWSTGDVSTWEQQEVLRVWRGPLGSVHLTLFLFCINRFWMCALATTLPVPAGVFMPVFTIGAAFGRLMGESMAVWFPAGVGGALVVPGGYAVVGAAALSASVTHTISTSVIVFELTGQMSHVLPCIIAVLVSCAVATVLQVSIYDSIIIIKRLPFLPEISSADSSANAHRVFVEDFMVRRVRFLSTHCTYARARHMLNKYNHRTFPLVDLKDTMILLGSVQRQHLEALLGEQLSTDKRDQYFRDMKERFLQGSAGRKETQHVGKDQVDEATVSAPLLGVAEKTKIENTERSKSLGRFSVSRPTVQSTGTLESAQSRRPARPAQLAASYKEEREEERSTPFSAGGLTADQIASWERLVLQQPIDFDLCHIDPAPFQLVERTSLYKVHSIFSLLSLHHAYVTNMGRLVGIVSMNEVRNAVQGHIVTQMDAEKTAPSAKQDEIELAMIAVDKDQSDEPRQSSA